MCVRERERRGEGTGEREREREKGRRDRGEGGRNKIHLYFGETLIAKTDKDEAVRQAELKLKGAAD